MIGAGKYDDELTKIREDCASTAAILILGNGVKGPGFSCQATIDYLSTLPRVLREVADQIEQDYKRLPVAPTAVQQQEPPSASAAPEIPHFLRKNLH